MIFPYSSDEEWSVNGRDVDFKLSSFDATSIEDTPLLESSTISTEIATFDPNLSCSFADPVSYSESSQTSVMKISENDEVRKCVEDMINVVIENNAIGVKVLTTKNERKLKKIGQEVRGKRHTVQGSLM